MINKLECYSVQIDYSWEGWGLICFKELFLYVILKLCAKVQFPTVPATAQKVCGVVVWCGGLSLF